MPVRTHGFEAFANPRISPALPRSKRDVSVRCAFWRTRHDGTARPALFHLYGDELLVLPAHDKTPGPPSVCSGDPVSIQTVLCLLPVGAGVGAGGGARRHAGHHRG